MKLLIVTQKVDIDDPILGFFHRWVVEFASHFDSIVIVCLEQGRNELPANVKVLSLGKERFMNYDLRFKNRITYTRKFYRYIWQEKNNYDAVFVHMNPIYVILGGLLWKLLGKRLGLWYVHRSVDLKLRLALSLVDFVATASTESFRLKSHKVHYVGHGVDTGVYSSLSHPLKKSDDKLVIMHVGRITPIKNCDTLIEAAKILKDHWHRDFKIIFVGDVATEEDKVYRIKLHSLIDQLELDGHVTFAGPVPNNNIGEWYLKADATVNLTPTGGLDKAVLESLATGVPNSLAIGTPTFFSNEAFTELFSPFNQMFYVPLRNSAVLAERIMYYFSRADRAAIEGALRKKVVKQFSLASLVQNLSELLTS